MGGVVLARQRLVVLVNHVNAPTWLALSGLLIAQVAAELALSATALGLVATPPKASGYHQWRPWWLLILVVFVFAAMPSDWTYLTTKLAAPLTVAHRGVDGQNGVPNSIAVLKKTHRAATQTLSKWTSTKRPTTSLSSSTTKT